LNDSSIRKIKEGKKKAFLFDWIDEIVIGKTLGSGAQGVVYQGTYKNRQVAIKSLHHFIDDFVVGNFVKEIKVLR
jgi:predicted Ser/Thr protein kinase